VGLTESVSAPCGQGALMGEPCYGPAGWMGYMASQPKEEIWIWVADGIYSIF
jgi:hypothetical protein